MDELKLNTKARMRHNTVYDLEARVNDKFDVFSYILQFIFCNVPRKIIIIYVYMYVYNVSDPSLFRSEDDFETGVCPDRP